MVTRPPPLLGLARLLGKLALFLKRGLSPAAAWWLARHDATVADDYRGAPLAALRGAWQAAGGWADIRSGAGRVTSTQLGLALEQKDDLVTRNYAPLCEARARGITLRREGGFLIASDGRCTLRITTDEEVNMLREIFVERCYQFHLEGRWQVLDIGANVGMASLFFAAQPWVGRVFAFEPSGPTAEACHATMQLNPGLRGKVALANYGWGEEDSTATVDYHPELRGSMSVAGLGDWRRGRQGATNRLTIRIRQASKVMAELEPQLAGHPLLAKIDCEGSEYGILRDLEKTGWLRRLDVIVLEWHQREPGEMLSRLAQAGFVQHVRPLVPDDTLGLILAVRVPMPPQS